MTKLYLCVTNDKYELPLAVADSVAELARMLGKTPNGIWATMWHAREKGHRCHYKEVEIDDFDIDTDDGIDADVDVPD